jgi:hypothetical protein
MEALSFNKSLLSRRKFNVKISVLYMIDTNCPGQDTKMMNIHFLVIFVNDLYLVRV